MRERVLAIVSIIAQFVMEERELPSETEIVEELLAVGFEAEEIDAAFHWMESQSLPSTSGTMPAMTLPSHRIFTRKECLALSCEARGFLIRLRTMGILDHDLEEEIIEQAMQVAEDEISLKELKTIAALTLFARSHDSWRREIDQLLDDDWSQLYH